MRFEPISPSLQLMAEGPVWCDDGGGSLSFVDIHGMRLHRVDWRTRREEIWTLPSEVGSAAPDRHGGFVLALRDGFHLFDPSTQNLVLVARPDHDLDEMRLNDGRCDPAGRFWAGTVDLAKRGPRAGFWCLDGGVLRRGPHHHIVCNGLAFSPDARWMYTADSATGQVFRHAYDVATGEAGLGTVWADLSGEAGVPDGASVDQDGFYWVAMNRGACLLRLDPRGRVDRRIPVPVNAPTMVGFAGPDLDCLVVTTSRFNRPSEPLAGAVLLVANCGSRGIAESRYR